MIQKSFRYKNKLKEPNVMMVRACTGSAIKKCSFSRRNPYRILHIFFVHPVRNNRTGPTLYINPILKTYANSLIICAIGDRWSDRPTVRT